jgi:hypothetical protein
MLKPTQFGLKEEYCSKIEIKSMYKYSNGTFLSLKEFS